jgi:DNA primase
MRATKIAQEALVDHPDVFQYLTTDRGLTVDTIEEAQLGFIDRSFMEGLRKDFSMSELRQAGIVGRESNDPWVVHALCIPYPSSNGIQTLRGKVIGGRTIGLHGLPVRLYLVDKIKNVAEPFICEGEMDALLLNQMGYPAAGVPGADVFKDHWTHFFSDAKRIYLVPDHDNINPNTGKRPGLAGAEN